MPPRVVFRSRAASSTFAVSWFAAVRSESCLRSSAIAAVRLVTALVVRERLRSPRLRSDSSTEALLLSRTSRALAVLCLLLEARPALVADLVVASREEVADVVVLVHAHRFAVCLQDFGDHLGEGPPVAKAFEDARDVFVHRPPPGRGDFLDPVREPEREPVGDDCFFVGHGVLGHALPCMTLRNTSQQHEGWGAYPRNRKGKKGRSIGRSIGFQSER